MPLSYAELHCHSAFSLLDGASSPEELVARAASLGYAALALTDHDDLGGAVRFGQAAAEAGVEGMVGAELTVLCDDDASPAHLVLIATSREGYANLSTLVTRARMDRPRGEPGVPVDVLAAHARDLVALTGCPRGRVPSLLAAGDHAGAWEAACTLRDIFGDRLAVECWDHGLAEERALVAELVPLARRLGVPWVVTSDAHHAAPAGRVAHDVLSALRHGRALDEMGTRLRPSGAWHLPSPRALYHRWRHDTSGLRATLDVAARCEFRMSQLRATLPDFPLPPGVTADEYLERLVMEGARERWGTEESEVGSRKPNALGIEDSIARDAAVNFRPPTSDLRLSPASDSRDHRSRQLRHELSLIRKLGLAGYFLIVWDIVRFARREGILCQGRGSAANSAVCYCLGITAVDPIRMGLLFERFLSENRSEAPDIDIDFAHRERERVLQYVYERYGREHAAMVCEHITWRGRSAVRDAARALGFSQEQAAALATYSDRFSARATAAALRVGTEGREDAPGGGGMVAREAAGAAIVVVGGGPPRPEPSIAPSAMSPTSASSAASSAAPSPPALLATSLVRGTEATTRAAAVRHEARTAPLRAHEVRDAHTSRDARVEHAGNAAHAPWLEPHAGDGHVERRDPVTAIHEHDTTADTVLTRAGLDPTDRRVRLLSHVVDGLHQLPRHRSIHVGGFVLTGEPLATVVPIEPAAMPGRTVIQWEKDDLDPVNLVKIDLLGLGMLTLLQDCLAYIRRTRGVSLDLATIPQDDSAVYDMLCRADTIGVFQVESRAQQNTLPRLRPRCFYDLVVQVALIRPGPIQGDMVHPFLRRRAGVEEVTYPHPSLEPILKRTLGVPLFQEQGMQVAITCAGFTPTEADELRRAMGHKRSRERMAELCDRLVAGMARNGIPEETAMRIYNQINAFADYGFPESHAASFALLVYASAYLKHHYAPEFTAALLNAQPMGFYSPGTIIEDARRHGVEVGPVDLRVSGWDHSLEMTGGMRVAPRDGVVRVETRTGGDGCAVEDSRVRGSGDAPYADAGDRGFRGGPPAPASLPAPSLRLGIRSIRGLGAAAREKLEAAMTERPFTSVADVVRRTGLHRRALRLLAESGAMDGLVSHLPPERRRRAALWEALEALRGA
ncbi:MAG TPA: PHP domain-containing protein, partial [Gemmatimonadales bacterium]